MQTRARKQETYVVANHNQPLHVAERNGRIELTMPLDDGDTERVWCAMSVVTATHILEQLLQAIARARNHADRDPAG